MPARASPECFYPRYKHSGTDMVFQALRTRFPLRNSAGMTELGLLQEPQLKKYINMIKYRSSETYSTAIGEKIRSLRKRLGISQEQLGEIAGVSYQQIQKYENGTDRVSANRLKKIADALNIPINYFFEETILKAKETESVYHTLGELTKEEIELIKLFRKVGDKRAKGNLLKLIKSAEKIISER